VNKNKLKLELLHLPLVGQLLRPFFVKRLADQEKRIAPGGENTEIFSTIYKDNLWAEGAKTEGFYSGSGTHSPSGSAYVNFIDLFVRRNQVRSITDIGSGDFTIGKAITVKHPDLVYNGVDVVPSLINHNQKTFGNDRISFHCIDASKNEVPPADLLTIRQVLQHLSNDDISSILKHASKFRFVLITEHILKQKFLTVPNIDKPSGKSTRAGFGSAVMVDKPPFNLRCTEVFRIEEDELGDIVTYLLA
jgi:hypothetical protein